MATVLDNELERHLGPEPRVLAEDVQAVLRSKIRPGLDDAGESVSLVAARANVSTRTVYRVLNPSEPKETISLDLADRLCVAAEAHLSQCRLVWPGGVITEYPVALPGILG